MKTVIILPHRWNVEEGRTLLVTKTWQDEFNYAEVEVSDMQHFFFEAGGLELRLSVGQNGFNLWDNKNGQWILDAQLVGSIADISIGRNEVLRGVFIEPGQDDHYKNTRLKLRPKVEKDGQVIYAAEAHPPLPPVRRYRYLRHR